MRGQTAIESAMLISMMMAVMVIFALFMTERVATIREEKDKALLEEMTDVIRNEIFLASTAQSGYHREFQVPEKLYGKDYQITLTSSADIETQLGYSANFSELVVRYVNYTTTYEVVASLPKDVTGKVRKGANVINKRKEVVIISRTCDTCFADEDVCMNAAQAVPDLCDGLDILWGAGYQESCCSSYNYCC